MLTLEQFVAKQEAELDKKRKEIADLERLGPIPGLEPRLVHDSFRGHRYISFNLKDLATFVEWAESRVKTIQYYRGKYTTFHPDLDGVKDYEDARVYAAGSVVVEYSTIMRKADVVVYFQDYELSFAVGNVPAELRPVAKIQRLRFGEPKILSWEVARFGQAQLISPAIDKQSCDLKTLLVWSDFKKLFLEQRP